MNEVEFIHAFESPIGTIVIKEKQNHLVGLQLGETINRMELSEPTALFSETRDQINAYFQGRLIEFSLPFCLSGTLFQKQLWLMLQNIKYGTTVSYKELAQSIGNVKSFRAVGNAVGKNPLPIIFPCHRVIRSDGRLGGYLYGRDLKEFLINLEMNRCKDF